MFQTLNIPEPQASTPDPETLRSPMGTESSWDARMQVKLRGVGFRED